jgi:hypothetical protein
MRIAPSLECRITAFLGMNPDAEPYQRLLWSVAKILRRR